MSLRSWLGLAEKTAPPAKAAQPDLAEYGSTGTPIFGGFLRDAGEYNPDLEGLSAFGIYEKMRRSDAQVAATLMGMKLPIRSAEWAIVEPEDATPAEKEASEFIEQTLLEEIDLGEAIDNALLMLDFGASAHEDVYYMDGNRVRLTKLAPRLPLTFYRWMMDGEELRGLEQYGYAGGTYRTSTIPSEKLSLFTFQQEGANFAGRSLLRPMYQHWYIKSNLYKIDAIACERNGMGVPWIQMGPNAKREDRLEALDWLQKLSVHEKAALLLPPDWKFELAGVTGQTRDPKESIAHHNVAISMAGLAQFMMLGQSESGNRALGQTMSDFFYLALQATANKIARVFNWTTIPRLVDFNFAGIERYPQLVPQQILSLSFDTLLTTLKELAAQGVVEPDDDIEAWVRSKMGAPEKGKARPRTTQPPMQPAVPSAGMSEAGFTPSRPPSGAETFLALAEMVGALDQGRDDIAAALRRARPAIQAEIVAKVVWSPVATMYRISIEPQTKLVAEIERILTGVHEFGIGQVEKERARQLAGKAPGEAAAVRAADLVRRRKRREPLGVYADAVVAEFINTWTQRAVNVALDWLRRPGDLTKGEIIRRVEEELGAQSDKWMDGAAAKGANEAFADGRAAGYELYRDEVREVQVSALLDQNTCENCSAADGQVGATPDEITPVPNPDCDGGDMCRCVHVFVFREETQ